MAELLEVQRHPKQRLRLDTVPNNDFLTLVKLHPLTT